MVTRRAPAPVWLLCLAVAVHAGCGTRTFVRPTGPAQPAPDAAAAWAEASAACARVESYAGSLGLTGRVGGQRIRGLASATLDVAVNRASSLAVEARIAGQLVFRLGGTADRAVLWLSDGNRVATASASALLGALVGAGFAPSRLREILAGCPSGDAVTHAERYGRVIQGSVGQATVFLESAQQRWRVRAWTFDTWDISYDRLDDAGPQRLMITSRPGVTPEVALSLRVAYAQRDVEVPDSAFEVAVPDGARTVSLEELRGWRPRPQ